MKFDFLNRLKDFVGEEVAELEKERILGEYQNGKRLDDIVPRGLREDCLSDLTVDLETRHYSREQVLKFMERRRDWLYKKGICVKPVFKEAETGDEVTDIFVKMSFYEEEIEAPCNKDIVYDALHNVYEKIVERRRRLSESEIAQAVNRFSIENEIEDRKAWREIEGDRYGT